jgi:hypothetical protein
MHLDAIEHAAEIGDMQDSLLARQIKAEQHAAAEIRELLTVTVRKVHPKRLSLPLPLERSSGVVIASLEMDEAIKDAMTYGKPLEALLAVFANSECPLVAALREAVAADYIDRNAAEIGNAVV